MLKTLLALTLALALADAHSQTGEERPWPQRAIRMVVPAGPGSSADARARWLAQRLGTALGQTVYVDDRPGAGGNLGMELGAHAAPDGYTLVLVHQGTMTVNPHLYRHTGYDALADLVPVARLGVTPMVLAVNPTLPAASVAELIRLAKARPGTLSFGTPGQGTPPHLAGELFRRAAGIDVVHVPYKGGGQAIADLIAGQISFTLEGAVTMLPQVKAGKLRALATTGARRMAMLPAVPTLAESGLDACEYETWTGVAVPAGTPPAIVQRLAGEIDRIYGSPDGVDYLATTGSERRPESPAAFAADIRRESAHWAAFIRDTGLRAE